MTPTSVGLAHCIRDRDTVIRDPAHARTGSAAKGRFVEIGIGFVISRCERAAEVARVAIVFCILHALFAAFGASFRTFTNVGRDNIEIDVGARAVRVDVAQGLQSLCVAVILKSVGCWSEGGCVGGR